MPIARVGIQCTKTDASNSDYKPFATRKKERKKKTVEEKRNNSPVYNASKIAINKYSKDVEFISPFLRTQFVASSACTLALHFFFFIYC